MKEITLGRSGIRTVQNAFGVLPLQRVDMETAVKILRRAYEGGIRFYDTARDYTDSESKIGAAFFSGWGGENFRRQIIIATKTHAHDPEGFWKDLRRSLSELKTPYVDIYQFHLAQQCYRPGDGTGMYECMLEAKEQGLIRHIGLTSHRQTVAMEAAASGLYETVQYPFSYLSAERDMELVQVCKENNVGLIAMKALSGGLITRSDAAMAFMTQFDHVLPIWGIQREKELEEWLSFMDSTPELTEEMQSVIEKDRQELCGEFCRACGYCLPCPVGIAINQCARMSLLLRRMPYEAWLSEKWQGEMKKIESCLNCRQCAARCPYGLNIPELLKKNYEDYKKVLAGEVKVNV
ncbi:MAG: aldo/keto reductase [Stomatobaculum sp.]|nr:aldo/keto reductase [Stomatobaculum sp.]